MEIARKYDLLVIEDCAHAIESEYQGQKAGRFGDIACFSFYVTKNIVTFEVKATFRNPRPVNR